MKKILLVLFLATIAMTAYSQNLDKMLKEKRESTLIDTAKKIVLKYGPDYYREYKEPTIGQRFVVGNNDEYYGKENSGRALYSVIFYYDTIKEILDYKYAARVAIWEDTGKACEVFFGNGLGFGYLDNPDIWKEITDKMPYHEVEIFPDYDLDHPEKTEPLNIDELKRRGYKDKGNKKWVKENLHIPPKY